LSQGFAGDQPHLVLRRIIFKAQPPPLHLPYRRELSLRYFSIPLLPNTLYKANVKNSKRVGECPFALFLAGIKKIQSENGSNHEEPRPPRVKGIPPFGNTFQFLRDTSKLLDDAYRKHESVFRLRTL